ncbi:GH15 family glucan-1,4-alpha-glucosidase [Actinomadura coerulea]|uniref:GH15 family glucan-1,4-alpha-glucosidase n=1 Tax=Actinomadura coerulea TaxID=46159 RepID=A0A7X0G2T8_9ACTN|nr:glycoside hydrolase family 15 protein [Actinomadura coerulea]MBB6398367.1 GH15 family glucan-1,4-alpha-glucosidase [Actinomadura coerulea]GGQ10263.1 glucoamylase [Actinomadura coerulea]
MRSELSVELQRMRWRSPADAAATAVAAGIAGVIGRKYESPEIGDTAVIGNGHGRLAVFGPDGNVCSWNVPFGHGVPVCNGLYDGTEDTAFRLGVAGQDRPTDMRLKANSATLVSTWTSPTGQARERAVMVGSPTTPDGNQLVRRLTCDRGSITATLDFRLRYGHAGEQPVQWTVLRSGRGFTEYVATVGNVKMFFTTNMHLTFGEGGTSVRGSLPLKAKKSAFFAVGGHDSLSPRTDKEAKRLIVESEKGWLKYVQSLRNLRGKYAGIAIQSAINLRLLGYGDGGSFYAAATRSLPEDDPRLGLAVRCWDYLKDWERDAGLTVLSLTDAGDQKVLLARYRWYKKLHDIRHRLAIMHEVDGGNVADNGEIIIPGIGHRGSVYRVGNGAGDQKQHDWTSYAAEVCYRLALQGLIDLEFVASLAEQARDAMFKPCSGVWEIRPAENQENGAKLRVYASAQILNGQALAYFSKIFEMAGEQDKAREYKALAAKVMPWVRDNCVKRGVIVAAPDVPVLDSSILLAFMQAPDMFESGDEELVRATALAIDEPHTTAGPLKGLRVGKGHVRYHAAEFQDGISLAEEGLFNNITGWLAIVFLQLGMLQRAETLMGELMGTFNRVRQASEENTPGGRALGNLNQAYVYQAVIWFALLWEVIMAELEKAQAAEAASRTSRAA